MPIAMTIQKKTGLMVEESSRDLVSGDSDGIVEAVMMVIIVNMRI
jgi:hypothetical protein